MKSAASSSPIWDRAIAQLVPMLIVVALVAGCDPGFGYRPQGWQAVEQRVARWSTSLSQVDLETDGIGGLVGDRSITPEFEIRNRTDRIFILERAELITPSGRHLGTLPDDGALEARTLKPRATDRIAILWKFERRAQDVLGTNPQIILQFRLDDQQERLTITYERVP